MGTTTREKKKKKYSEIWKTRERTLKTRSARYTNFDSTRLFISRSHWKGKQRKGNLHDHEFEERHCIKRAWKLTGVKQTRTCLPFQFHAFPVDQTS